MKEFNINLRVVITSSGMMGGREGEMANVVAVL